MRDTSTGRVAAARIRTTDTSRRDEVLLLVCGALVLALVTLAGRIVAVW